MISFQVERLNNDYEVIGKNMFKKETNLQCFVGLKVSLSTGEVGSLDGTFGQSGKFKIRLMGKLASLEKPTRNEKSVYRVCHRFRLTYQNDYFKVTFDHF